MRLVVLADPEIVKSPRMKCAASPPEEYLMPFRTNHHPLTPNDRPRPMINCAQCGEVLFLPEWSEYRDKNSVRHLWKCEVCDYTFETTIHYEIGDGIAPGPSPLCRFR
jgi:hypothetical protein